MYSYDAQVWTTCRTAVLIQELLRSYLMISYSSISVQQYVVYSSSDTAAGSYCIMNSCGMHSTVERLR